MNKEGKEREREVEVIKYKILHINIDFKFFDRYIN